MINFIACDNNSEDLKFISNTIDNVMMGNEIAYKKHLYNEYGTKFISEVLDSKISNKIFILDIQVPGKSGLDVARQIREKDVDSVIIFVTSYNELGANVLNNELMSLTFINKLDNEEERLKSAIQKSLQILNAKRIIRFNDHGVIYTIPVNDIIYITRDTVERKCVIKTEYNDFKVKKSLSELSEMLGSNFIETHRSCIANKNRIRKFDKKKRIIMFDSGDTTDLVSENFKRGAEI